MFQFPLPPPSGWRRKNFIHIPAKTGVGGFFCPDCHQEGTANCFIRCISETTSGWQTACFWPLLSQVRMRFQWGYLLFATGMLSRSQKKLLKFKGQIPTGTHMYTSTCTFTKLDQSLVSIRQSNASAQCALQSISISSNLGWTAVSKSAILLELWLSI